jgi:hypothetical protein
MGLSRMAGGLVSACLLGVALLISWVVWAYLTESGSWRQLTSVSVAVLGSVAAALVYRFLSRRSGRGALAIVMLLLAALSAVPLVSMYYPGQVTYSRFGLTVYGVIPVPFLDVTVGPCGGLWFRDKTHLVTIDEVERLLSPEVEAVIIGIGWHSAVQIDPAVRELVGPVVLSAPTPEAFRLFNQYKSQGRVVVLIAHSTC